MRRHRVMMVLAAAVWCAAPLAATGAAAAGSWRPGGEAVISAGVWRKAIEVPGTAVLNAGGTAGVNSVSCSSAGDCAAGGQYTDRSGHAQAFVASERNGTWHKAIEVPGTAALNAGADQARGADVTSVSCSSGGNCAAGGGYDDRSGHGQAFVASERNGTWRKAIEVPGTAALNVGGSAVVDSVSCGLAGNCAAGGFYTDRSGHF